MLLASDGRPGGSDRRHRLRKKGNAMTVCPHNCGLVHISLDLDDVTNPKDVKNISWPWWQSLGPNMDFEGHWRLSASGKGSHLLLCVREPLLEIVDIFEVRLINGDDWWRLAHDLMRCKDSGPKTRWGRYIRTRAGFRKLERWASGVVFDRKNGKKAGEWQPWPSP